MDYKETIKERIKVLPESLKSFVLDENWRREAEKIGRQFNFDQEKYALFENEVFLVLLCFESKNSFAENIKRELGLDSNTINWIDEYIDKNIFSKVAIELDAVEQQMIENEKEEKAQSGVGQSFEQIILNQARAMQPARPQDETGGIMNYESRIMEKKDQAPENLPTEQKQDDSIKTPDYSKQDPYREPTE